MPGALINLYDPKSKIKKFKFEEDFDSLRTHLLGRASLWRDVKFSPSLGVHLEWKRPRDICRRPIFISGKHSRFDALQGYQDDCWLVSAIEAITLNDKLIKHVVPTDQAFDEHYIGAFHFRIWQLGTWYDVVVDDYLPVFKSNQTLCSVHSMSGDIFWAALLEKAYMKFCGHISDKFFYGRRTPGYNMDALQDFSGGIVERVLTSSPPFGTSLKWFMKEAYSKNALMCCRCYNNPGRGLVENHAYPITKVFKCSDDDPDYHGLFLVRIMNPYGHTEWEGNWNDNDFNLWKQIDRELRQKLLLKRNDGEFWMDDEDFVKYFERIRICHLGPGQYIESRKGVVKFRQFNITALTGEWVKNISSGGAGLHNRHKNPQYKFQVEWPADNTFSDLPGTVFVIIELVQRSHCGLPDREQIAFYMYSLNKLNDPPMPLNQSFFENNQPINDPDFSVSQGRAFNVTMRLEPGKYCIVPCTLRKDIDSKFLLRVYSQSPVDLLLVYHDTKISKSLPTEEQRLNESQEWLKMLFDDTAQGQDEIDCFGLKEVLEGAMKTERSYSGMIASLFNFLKELFGKYISLLSSNENKTGDVVFTKDECRRMIAMLDDNHSGKLSFSEFSNLWNKIDFWTKSYEQHRVEAEGYVTVSQLRDALSSIGYNIDKRTLHSLSYVYANEQGNIFLTDFILCGVALETVLALCQKKDLEGGNEFTFTLKEWVKNTLNL